MDFLFLNFVVFGVFVSILVVPLLLINPLQNNFRSFSPSFRREFEILKEKVESGEIRLARMGYDSGKTIGVFKTSGEELFRIYEFPSITKPGEEYFGQNSNTLGYAELRRWAEKVVGESKHKKSFNNI